MNDMTTSPLIIYNSPVTVKETIDRIDQILRDKNIMVFARINHGAAAKQAGIDMQDEELLIFGNPKIGTDLMLENPAIGIELPLKILAWRDDSGTKVGHQNMESLIKEYGIYQHQAVIANMAAALSTIVTSAISNK